jgi:O-antigen ligase
MSAINQQLGGVLRGGQTKIAFFGLLVAGVVGLLLTLLGVPIFLAMLVLCAVVALIVLKPETTTLVVLFTLFANLTVIVIRAGVPSFSAGLFYLLLFIPFFNFVAVRQQPVIVTPALILALVHFATLLLSSAFSQNVASSLNRTQTFLLEGVLLFFLILNTLRTPEMLRRAIWVLLFSGALIGSLSVYQKVTNDYTNDFSGLAQVTDDSIGLEDADFLGNREMTLRLAGQVGEKNRYAQVMLMIMPLALSRVWAERSYRLRILAGFLGVLIFAGALLTFSRGGFLAIAIVGVAMLVLGIVKLRTMLLIGVAFMIVTEVVAPGYLYRMGTLAGIGNISDSNFEEDTDGAMLGRATVNLAATQIFLNNPILGVGPGQVSSYIRVIANRLGLRVIETERRAHNLYLEQLADTGVIGFAAFMAVPGLLAFQLFRLLRRWKGINKEIFYTAGGILLCFVSYFSTATFLHLSYHRYYYLLIALAGITVYVFGKITVEEARKLPNA